MTKVMESVHRRITSDSVKTAEFQMLELMEELRRKVTAEALKIPSWDHEDMTYEAMIEVMGTKKYARSRARK